MSTISITCEQDLIAQQEQVETFLNIFQLLPPKQKLIWEKLRWYCATYRNAFPSHVKLAEMADCHRDTVIKAMKRFRDYGWIVYTKRCYRSNVYYMSDVLEKIDTTKSSTFRKPKAPVSQKKICQETTTVRTTRKPTEKTTLLERSLNEVCNVRLRNSEEKSEQEKKYGDVQYARKEKMHLINSCGINNEKDVYLLLRFEIHAIRLAYEDFKTRVSKHSIKNIAAWFTSRCKHYQAMAA